MAIVKQAYEVKGHRFSRESRTHRTVRDTRTSYRYQHKEAASVTTVVYHGTFRVVIDLPTLIDLAVRRASRTKGGKSTLVDGLIVAKLVGAPVEESRSTRELPLSAGYEVIADGR